MSSSYFGQQFIATTSSWESGTLSIYSDFNFESSVSSTPSTVRDGRLLFETRTRFLVAHVTR